MGLRRLLTITGLLTAALVVIVIWFYPPTGDFRADNPSWNGLERFSEEFNASLVTSLRDRPKYGVTSLTPDGTVLFVIPYAKLTSPDLEELEGYVSSGGTLVVLDDYGHGNQVLIHLGLAARFTGKQLLDPVFNYKNKWMIEVRDFSPSVFTDGVESIMLNHPSSLAGVSESEALAWSSQFSFVDVSGDAAWDEGEPTGSQPVAARIVKGNGSVVLVADPSILISSMIEMGDNFTFIENVIESEGVSPRVLVDQSHFASGLGDEVKAGLAVSRRALSTPVGIFGLVAVILTFALRPVWNRKGENGG